LWSKEIGTQYLVFFFLVSNSPGYVRYARRKVKQKVVEIKKGEKSSNSRHILEKITLKMREKMGEIIENCAQKKETRRKTRLEHT
jgi:hypothetical protein